MEREALFLWNMREGGGGGQPLLFFNFLTRYEVEM